MNHSSFDTWHSDFINEFWGPPICGTSDPDPRLVMVWKQRFNCLLDNGWHGHISTLVSAGFSAFTCVKMVLTCFTLKNLASLRNFDSFCECFVGLLFHINEYRGSLCGMGDSVKDLSLVCNNRMDTISDVFKRGFNFYRSNFLHARDKSIDNFLGAISVGLLSAS